ncbi:MAG TPA: hypothetical protein PKM63_17390 [Panacibacter sp.]|nr:hypothetical protein [Panacibacter sp.]HNP46071.1 hypothetical protein [Panacibacter sp.]
MKNFLTLCTCTLVGLSVHSQITMTPQVTPVGIVQKPALWNVLLVNNDNSATVVKLQIQLTNTATGTIVLTAESSSFSLPAGTTVTTLDNVSPVIYDYPSPGAINQDPNGFLPIGEYEACYTLSKLDNELFVVVAESCIDITIEPLSPPLLSAPGDQEEVATVYPQFSWIPPAPLNMFINPSYDLVLVEVLPGQQPAEALQQNIPVYVAGNMQDIFLNYPAANTALDTSKLYAWQVIAKDNGVFAAQSEVWSFRVKKDTFPTPNANENPYVKLQQNLGASVTECEDILKVYYNNEAGDTTIAYTISSLDNADLGAVVKTGTLTIGLGENFIDVPLINEDRLLEGKVYLFAVVNSRNQTWALKLMYHQSINQ